MKLKVNYQIALTHILTRKKQTIVAAMGVTIGIALYIFSNSIVAGFGNYSKSQMFKTIPHIRIYKEDQISRPLFSEKAANSLVIIANPKITAENKSIVNPYGIIEELKKQTFILNSVPQVNVDMFYNNGKSQLKGVGSGVNIIEADAMFNIQSTMIAGNLLELASELNGIIIGKGIAEKMNIDLGDNISVTSSWGVIKVMKVVGIFSVGNKTTDESKSYINITAAQQLVKESSNFVTDIYASVANPDSAIQYSQKIQELTSYKVEDWQTANAEQLASNKILATMNPMIALSIMMVAAFGIYNILNMTITQKMNDIAILKATGFSGRDIIKIFVSEAFIMGFIGTFLGLVLGALLIRILQSVYIGPPIGYFPVYYDPAVFVTGAVFGLIVSLGAGFLPARKAAKVDPVAIFRK
jgi:lipoprotein-releasing system permease protein